MVVEPAAELAPADAPRPELGDAAAALLRDMHTTVAGVTDDLEKFHFNRAVARIREFTNALEAFREPGDAGDWVRRAGLETAVRLIGPVMPHLAEELWARSEEHRSALQSLMRNSYAACGL